MKTRGAPQKARNSKLAAMMTRRGLSSKELVERTGFSNAALSYQRADGIQTLRVAKRYAAALDCDPLELIG